MIKLLVFSKDRACQLDLTLRSIAANFRLPCQMEVLWDASSRDFERGYEELLKIYGGGAFKKWKFIRQTSFKKDVLGMLEGDYKYLTTSGDDLAFTMPIGEEEAKAFDLFDANPQILAVKYWMGKDTIGVCENEAEKQPDFFYSSGYDKFPVWSWAKAYGEKKVNWGYPMNLMVQFYRREDIVNYWPRLDFDCPNMIEGTMMADALVRKQFMICFEDMKVVELAYNRVQTVAPQNRRGNTSTEEFNKWWLDGWRISFDVVDDLFHSGYGRYWNRPFELIER